MKKLLLTLLLLTALTPCGLTQTQPAPSLLNFQGRLARPDGTPVADGNYSIRFSLWSAATGGAEKWNQTLNPVTVRNGTFAVLLNVASPATLFDTNLWMEIKIGSDAPLSPRQQLVSVAYALKANTVPDNSITNNKIVSLDYSKLTNVPPNSGTAWSLTGNASINPSLNFLGTTDDQPLIFRSNNLERMRLLSNGNFGIGTNSPGSRLDVRGLGGVHFFAGDRTPFGQSAFETDFSTAQTHAWFAENGTRVFSVRQGGEGYFAGSVGIGREPEVALDVNGGIRSNLGITAHAAPFLFFTDPAIYGEGDGVHGVRGTTNDASFAGVKAENSSTGSGLWATSAGGDAIFGNGANNGVHGRSAAAAHSGVWGENTGAGYGVAGSSNTGVGVLGVTSGGSSFGGLFVNNGGGVALRAEGLAQIGVLEITGGADLAEKFEVRGAVKPGMVVEIDPLHPGALRLAKTAYSKRVAGILSGAKQLNAGMVLSGAKGSHAVALTGRVWVHADARKRAIEPGDLLTTSTLAGHAMQASDARRSHGAILGKAMTALPKGKTGMVLALVNLQ